MINNISRVIFKKSNLLNKMQGTYQNYAKRSTSYLDLYVFGNTYGNPKMP